MLMSFNLISTSLIAVALAMDAFSVSMTKGFTQKNLTKSQILYYGLFFGGFQAGMPLLGYLLGTQFESLITNIDHWIAFVLLGIIGFNMIHESLSKSCEKSSADFSAKAMFPLAVATSIDALAVGISLAFLNENIVTAATIIGITTLILSAIGIYIGNAFGCKYKSKAEFLGGAVLILIGIKILVEHTILG